MTVEQLWQRVPGGSGTYISELARALAQRNDVSLTGIAARHSGPPAMDLPAMMTVKHSSLPRIPLYELWTRHRRFRPTRHGNGDGAPVTHATTWAIPPSTGPLVVTVHDVAFLHQAEHFTPRGNRFFHRALAIVRSEADVVVVPSDTTARDCIAQGIDASRIRVIPHGVQVPAITTPDVDRFRAAHGIERPYVMWCGTFEPRKNLVALLDAYLALGPHTDLDLVLVGPAGWGDAANEVTRRVAALPEGRVHRLGHLSGTDLHQAYAGARVFCYPSIWEGFGLPVIEAMAHGIPVVTSQGTSMAELVREGEGILVDPHAPDQIAAALTDASGPRHDDLATAAAAGSHRFTWERSAELHMQAYRAAR